VVRPERSIVTVVKRVANWKAAIAVAVRVA
jgi:hypothetical protein